MLLDLIEFSEFKAEWMSARYLYQPFIIMITYSPVFLLARSRLYSSPLPSIASALEVSLRSKLLSLC